jgi:hypothetical protein
MRYVSAAPAGVPARQVHALEPGAELAACGVPAWPFPSGVDFDPAHPMACRRCAQLAR